MKSFIAYSMFALLMILSPVANSEYPTKPIRIVLGMSAASTFPIITRTITSNVPDKNFHFFNDHKTGQGNLVAYQFAANSKPDGYTIVFTSTSVVINPLLHRDAGYDASKNFEPLLFIGTVDNGLIAHPLVPFNTTKQLVAYAKRNPNKIMYGHNGFATQSYLAMELLAHAANIKFTSVPYSSRGTDQAFIDVAGGQIDLSLIVIGRVGGYVSTGKVKLIATTGSTRSKLFPNVPTMGESIKGTESSIWYILQVPTGVPPDIKQRLSAQLIEGMKSIAAQSILENVGVEPVTMEQAAMVKFIALEAAKWKKITTSKQLKIE